MQRLAKMATDPWYHRIYKRLKAHDLEFLQGWIAKNDHLGEGAYEMAINRMFLDKPELREKHKNWTLILEAAAFTNVGHSHAQGGPDLLETRLLGPSKGGNEPV